jgi:ATP-dependent exoDNAse (exonuclease V) beta subunit
MAEMAITMAKSRAQRHEAVEEFFIANDSSTFAVEVPVYIFPEEAPELNLKEPLTGHIDILQYRNNKIYILDYKPDQDPATTAQQLYLYKLALSIRAGIPMSAIATAAFNEAGYVEFG